MRFAVGRISSISAMESCPTRRLRMSSTCSLRCADDWGTRMSGLDLGTILTMTYAWLKAGHIIFVIFWMAGMFMLPRYYIYHQESAPGSAEEKRWIDRERKLRTIILTPSMILVWVFGITLATVGEHWREGWLHA